MMDLDGADFSNESEYDVHPQTIEYDPSELPFMQEESIDTILPWTNQYKEKLAKYHGKEPGSTQILKKEKGKNEEIMKDTVHTKPPHDKSTPCINFNEGSVALMWDKRKGNPRYEHKDNNSWLGHFIP
jgi:hypothetical protein